MGKLEFAAGLLLIASLITSTAQAEEEYYTWIDENGITNYAERNPDGYEARFVTREQQRFGYREDRLAPEPESDGPMTDEELAEATANENAAIDAEIASEQQRIDQEIAAAKKSNCNIGKLNLAQLSNYNRIRIKDDDGKVRVLTDDEKAKRIAKARQTIIENCNG